MRALLPVCVMALLVITACSRSPGSGNTVATAIAAPVAPAAPAHPLVTPAAVTGDEVHTEVPVHADGGTFTVPVMINGVLSLNFTIDSGASDVVIPADVAGTLVRSGTLTRDDLLGDKTFVLANGEEVPSAEFRIHTLKVGTLILHDVVASVGDAKGSLLLGQTFLSRLASWSFDNSRQTLLLKAAGAGVEAGAAAPPSLTPTVAPEAPQIASSQSTYGESVALTPDTATTRALAYLAAWSSQNDPNGDAVKPFYAPVVRFYGSDVSLDDLMAQKRAFATRWPSRLYAARPTSLTASCSDEHICQVGGVVDWVTADRDDGRRSAGVATFLMTFRDGLIAGETGNVLSRQ